MTYTVDWNYSKNSLLLVNYSSLRTPTSWIYSKEINSTFWPEESWHMEKWPYAYK